MAYIRLNKHYIHQHFLTLGIIEILLLVAAAWVAQQFYVYTSGDQPYGSGGLAWGELIIFALILSFCTLSMGVYISLVREGFGTMALRTIVSYFLLGSVALYLVNFASGGFLLSSALIFWGVLLATPLVFIARALFLAFIDTASMRRRVVILGAGQRAQALLDALSRSKSKLGVEVVCCIPVSDAEHGVTGTRIASPPKDWLAFVADNDIHEVVVAPDERRAGKGIPLDALLDCKVHGVPSTDILSFLERELNYVDVDVLNPSWLLYSDGFRNSRRTAIVKRLFDVVVAVLFLLVLWPFMLLTALAVRLDSPGPILYSQERVGLKGKVFRIYKFRSMRVDAEQNGKAVWAQKNDSRVTRVGAFIRNTRLDELPQLYNVLMGSMSFVGPRPERPQFVQELAREIPFYDVRHKVKPGLMGWAQLKYPYGASVEDAKYKLTYDLYYAKNKSIMLDLLILVQTVEVILLGKGVH